MMTLSSIIDPLRAANRLSRLPLFSWNIVSLTAQPITLSCGLEIQVNGGLELKDFGDLLVVVAGFNHVKHSPPKELTALRSLARRFVTIFGVESGTWVLARAGIISNHRVTTHWEDTEKLADNYSGLDVRGERFVIDHNIWTSGGASPTLDMILHYLRTTQNKSLAMDVASVFIYKESNAPTDAQVQASTGRLDEIEPRLAQAVRTMEANIEEPLSVSQIARELNLSVRGLELLSVKYLGVTPGAYYLRLRLQMARRLVLDTNISLLEVTVRSGFGSQSAFSRAYKKRYSQTPSQMRKNFI